MSLLPSILVSFAYRKSWAKASRVVWREVVLDSGAYTVHNAGGVVDVDEFADWALEQKATNPLVTEVFSLDVIGDWRASLKNTEYLVKRGLDVVPVYHVGEPTDVLVKLCRDYDKVALGGAVGYSKKMEWAALCFKTVWPKRLHGLGFAPKVLRSLPFHTIDHSSWLTGPHLRQQFSAYDDLRLPMVGGYKTYSLSGEVQHNLNEEARARSFWRGRLPADFGDAPSVRLVGACASTIMMDALVQYAVDQERAA